MDIINNFNLLWGEFHKLLDFGMRQIAAIGWDKAPGLTLMFFFMRSTFALFAIGGVPRCTSQLTEICAGVALCLSAIFAKSGSAKNSGLPWPESRIQRHYLYMRRAG